MSLKDLLADLEDTLETEQDEAPRDGAHPHSYGTGYDAGRISALRDAIELVKEAMATPDDSEIEVTESMIDAAHDVFNRWRYGPNWKHSKLWPLI